VKEKKRPRPTENRFRDRSRPRSVVENPTPIHLDNGAQTVFWANFIAQSNSLGQQAIDLVGSGVVLLTPFGGKPWTEAAKYLATEYPLHLKTSMIDDGELMSAYHLDEAGAGLSGRLCRMAQPLEGEPSCPGSAPVRQN